LARAVSDALLSAWLSRAPSARVLVRINVAAVEDRKQNVV
jgi:hypothetical protein